MQCEGGVALVPQSFRPAFRWRVSDVVLMGGLVMWISLPSRTRRMPGGLSRRWRSWGSPGEDDFGAFGGQQQAGVDRPRAGQRQPDILLDEPCSALDLGNQQVVLQLIGDWPRPTARRAPSCSPPMIPTTPYRWPAIRCFCCRRAGGWRARPPTC